MYDHPVNVDLHSHYGKVMSVGEPDSAQGDSVLGLEQLIILPLCMPSLRSRVAKLLPQHYDIV